MRICVCSECVVVYRAHAVLQMPYVHFTHSQRSNSIVYSRLPQTSFQQKENVCCAYSVMYVSTLYGPTYMRLNVAC